MVGESLVLTFFVATMVLFSIGSLTAAVSYRQPRVANWLAHAFSFLGGISGAITALIALRGKDAAVLSLWHIVHGISLSFCIDSLSAFFLLVISALAIAVSVYATGYVTEYYHKKNVGLLGGGLNLFLLSMVLVVTVDNGFAFLLAWELMSIVSFGLVMYEHEREEVRTAGFIYVVMTHVATLFITLSFLSLYLFAGSFDFVHFKNIAGVLPEWLRNIIFMMLLVGFGAKAGIVPLHIWLPRAHPAAPSHISALMSAVMIKTAVYGLLRFYLDLLGGGPAWWGVVILTVGVVSALLGIIYGLAENDMKRFLAYSSAENMGIIFMGIGTAMLFQSHQLPMLAALALTAALYHSLNHAVFKGLLFMGAGAVLFATHTRNINELGGLIKRLPTTAILFLIGGLSLSALPPFNGFVSEWAIFQSLFHLSLDVPGFGIKMTGAVAISALGLTGAFAAGAMVKHFGTAFLAMPRSEHAEHAVEVPVTMRAGMFLLALSCVGLGVVPGFVLGIVENISEMMFRTHVQSASLFHMPFGSSSEGILFPGVLWIGLPGIVLLTVFFLRHWLGKNEMRVDETWNCGTTLRPSMEYTGTSFSNPVLVILQQIVGTRRVVDVHAHYAYYPRRINHFMQTHYSIEAVAYRPMVELTVKLAQKIRVIQNGNLQSYLAYMVIALIIALLWIGQVQA